LEQKLKEDLEPVSIRETNESEPFEDASLKIRLFAFLVDEFE